MKKIGLFGLTANPPHLGHLRVVEEAASQCDEVWVSPVYVHPFNKSFIDYHHRLRMVELMFEGLPKVKIYELDRLFFTANDRVPYSYDLLSYIQQKDKENAPKLIIGEDNYQKNVWQKFYKYDRIDAEFGVIVVKDFGLHSTQIREFVKNKDWQKVSESCGSLVTEYLKKNSIVFDGVEYDC